MTLKNFIGIDPGKFRLKAVTKENGKWVYFDLRSKLTKNPKNILMGDNYLITYKDDTYLVGEGGKDYSLETDKEGVQHKLCTYLAINQLINELPAHVVVGCPFKHFKNLDKRQSYQDYICDEGIMTFKVNDEEALINIQEVVAFPECAGIMHSEDEDDFANKTRAIIDIGGLNINGCIFENMNVVEGSDFTENLGSMILMDKIKSELNREFYEINLQDYDVPDVIKYGLYINGKRVKDADNTIQKVIEEHFSLILKEMKKKNWSTRTLKITAGGGGSLDIGEEILKKYMPQIQLAKDPVWGNAKGFYEVAQILFAGD